MNKLIKTGISLSLLMGLFVLFTSVASMQSGQTGTIGNMSREDFDRRNKEGAAAVAAVTATSAPLSKNDQKMMMEVAMGGMMQLAVSRVAVDKATNEEAKILAQSEVEEQTGLGAKLQEIATAKNITLPTAPDAKTQKMVSKMQAMAAGMNFDLNYVKESGVKGHEKLDKVMSKVESSATDSSLRGIATAAHPLVKTHLQVSREVVAKMSGGNRAMGGNSMSNSSMSGNSMSGNSMNMNSNSMNGNGNSNSMMDTGNRNSNSATNSNSNRP